MASRTRFRKPYKKRKLNAEINVVPYIDVMLVLLVIFMVTAPLLTQGVKINIPEAETTVLPVPKQEPIIVSIDNNGLISLNVSAEKSEVFDEQALFKKVASIVDVASGDVSSLKRDVFIQADKDIPYGNVMRLMAGLQSIGVENIGLLTQPKSI